MGNGIWERFSKIVRDFRRSSQTGVWVGSVEGSSEFEEPTDEDWDAADEWAETI